MNMEDIIKMYEVRIEELRKEYKEEEYPSDRRFIFGQISGLKMAIEMLKGNRE